MATYPSTRRYFKKAEVRNTAPDIALLTRDLMRWQNTTYARDLLVTPADPANYNALDWYESFVGVVWTPVSLVSGSGRWLGDVYLPDSKGNHDTVTLKVYVELNDSTAVGTFRVRNLTTGSDTDLAITYAALGSALTGWLSVDVPASPSDTLRLVGLHTSGSHYHPLAFSGWWKPKGDSSLIGYGETFSPVKTAELRAADGSHSTVGLRWLALAANRLTEGRPLQVLARWLGNYGYGSGNGWSGFPAVIGRYQIAIGERVSSLGIRLKTHVDSGTTATFRVTVGALGSVDLTHNSGASYRTLSGTLTFSARTALDPTEVTVEVLGSPAFAEAHEVVIFEDDAGVTAGGESVPTDFVANEDDAIWSGSVIRQDAFQRLLDNARWLWRHRRTRHLVCESRMSHPVAPEPYAGVDGESLVKAIKLIQPSRFAAAATEASCPFRFHVQDFIGGSATTQAGFGFLVEMDGQTNAGAYVLVPPTSTGASEPYAYTVLAAHYQIPQSAFPGTSDVPFRLFHNGNSKYAQKGYTIVEELPLGTPVIAI